jgi:PAS domain S-box-containing protein
LVTGLLVLAGWTLDIGIFKSGLPRLLVPTLALIYSVAFWINSRVLHRINEIARRHRESLHESEEQYRLLFSSMDEGFCTVEVIFDQNNTPVDYRFLEVNPAFEKQTGLKDAKGKRMRELAPQHEQHWFDIYGRIALTGEPARFENSAAALHRLYEVHAFRVGAPELRRVGIVFNDITERKRREDEMREAGERLRQAKEQAERASHTKDAFLAALSHELRTPLTPVLMMTGALREDERLPREVRDQLGMMKRNVELEARLIDDLLDLTRVSHGKLALHLELCDVHSVIGHAVDMVRSEATAKALSLEIELCAKHTHV